MGDTIDVPAVFDPSGMRPAMREKWALSGQTVNIRIHTDTTSIGFRGREYIKGSDGIIRDVPIEAVEQLEACTWWKNSRDAFSMRFDLVDADGKSLRQ